MKAVFYVLGDQAISVGCRGWVSVWVVVGPQTEGLEEGRGTREPARKTGGVEKCFIDRRDCVWRWGGTQRERETERETETEAEEGAWWLSQSRERERDRD